MKSTLVVALVAFVCAVFPASASKRSQAKPSPQSTSQQKTTALNAGDGQRKFETHCGRCHNPPEQLSPKASPAVLRHMRVRAMLTEEDEKAILEYIAP